MKLLVINGSPRKAGRTGIFARFMVTHYQAELIDLSKGEIPLFTGEDHQKMLDSVIELRRKVQEADAIIMATPEYHNGMSGALKNALDFLGSAQFTDKPVAILAVSGGGKGGINALNNLRIVGRGLYANVIPRQLVLDPPCFHFENDTLLPEASAQVELIVLDLKKYAFFSHFLREEKVY